MTRTNRMTRWTMTSIAALAVGALALSDTAWSQPPDGPGPRGRMAHRGPGGPGGPGTLGIPLGRLGLTDAQREQVQQVTEQNRDAGQAAGERVRAAREALDTAVGAEVFNEGAIRAAAGELGAAEADAAVQRAYTRSQIWQLLTPAQQTAALEAEAERRTRMDRRRERMRDRGPGRRDPAD